jgi:hypothetical protein
MDDRPLARVAEPDRLAAEAGVLYEPRQGPYRVGRGMGDALTRIRRDRRTGGLDVGPWLLRERRTWGPWVGQRRARADRHEASDDHHRQDATLHVPSSHLADKASVILLRLTGN